MYLVADTRITDCKGSKECISEAGAELMEDLPVGGVLSSPLRVLRLVHALPEELLLITSHTWVRGSGDITTAAGQRAACCLATTGA